VATINFDFMIFLLRTKNNPAYSQLKE